jgi:phytol kinase
MITGEGLLVFGLATLGLLAAFGMLEYLVRRRGAATELTRRAAHVAACLFALAVHPLLPVWLFVTLAIGFAGLMLLSRRFHVFTSIHKVRRRSLGDVYLPVGLAIGAALAGDRVEIFVAAALVLGLGDVAAGLTGDYLRATAKTWWGTAAFVAVAVVVVAACGFGVLPAVAVALIGAATERYSPLGTDNLTIPLVTAGLLLLLG